MSHIENYRLDQQHDRYAENSDDDEKLLQTSLAGVELSTGHISIVVQRGALEKEHVDELNEQIRRALGRVRRARKRQPLDQNHDAQVDKNECEKNNLRYKFAQNIQHSAKEQMI